MRERNATVIGALILLLLFFPLGWVVHASPRFPGSLPGSLLGIVAAILILLACTHSLVKRVRAVRVRLTRKASASTLLACHIYVGLLAAFLALVHSAHTFDSPLGISIVGILLLVLISGYAGRYLLGEVARAIRGRQSDLSVMKGALRQAADGAEVEADSAKGGRARVWRRLLLEQSVAESGTAERAAELASSIADTEFAIRTEEAANRMLSAATIIHVLLSIALVALLLLHVWAGLYYGLRWW